MNHVGMPGASMQPVQFFQGQCRPFCREAVRRRQLCPPVGQNLKPDDKGDWGVLAGVAVTTVIAVGTGLFWLPVAAAAGYGLKNRPKKPQQ